MELNELELSAPCPVTSSRELTDALIKKFKPDTNTHFTMDDRSMMDMYAIRKHVLDGSTGEGTIRALVMDLLTNLYTGEYPERKGICSCTTTLPEDDLYDYMMDGGSQLRNVADYCQENGLDRFNICDKFREVYGRTPFNSNKHHRMLMAASEILCGETNMGNIAELTGYGTENKFASAFRKEFGCRPKHFLKEYMTTDICRR